MSHLTLFSGPVIERDGSERMYVGAYIPETVDSHDRMRVQECIGFLAVPNYDPTTYPQPRDGWIARPARESEETIEDVFTTVCETGDYHQLSEPIERPVLEQLIGKEAVVPPKKAS
jgi:hypothetical protein